MFVCNVGKDSFHIAEAEQGKSMLSRYGILRENRSAVGSGLALDGDCAVLDTKSGKRRFFFERSAKGFKIRIPLTESERLFGLGDSTRERVMVRGIRANMHVTNVAAYGPMPVLMSSDGWGFVLNCTYESVFDCAKTDTDNVVIEAAGGEIDFFLFAGTSLRDLLSKITAVSGRPNRFLTE